MKTNKSLNILVTGGAGFLGSHIAEALTGAGHNVTIFDLKQSPYLKPKQEIVIGDIIGKTPKVPGSGGFGGGQIQFTPSM